jgi:hypothetical protein
MKASPLVVTVALEGRTDVPIMAHLLKDTGLELGNV